jgi:hypothetical protein
VRQINTTGKTRMAVMPICLAPIVASSFETREAACETRSSNRLAARQAWRGHVALDGTLLGEAVMHVFDQASRDDEPPRVTVTHLPNTRLSIANWSVHTLAKEWQP